MMELDNNNKNNHLIIINNKKLCIRQEYCLKSK